MSKIRLDRSVFDLLGGRLGFKHRGSFMSTNGDESGDYGEEHHFTRFGVRLSCKFAWTDKDRPWSYGFITRDKKFIWSGCDWPDAESVLDTVAAILNGAPMIGTALEDPLRVSYRPNLDPMHAAMVAAMWLGGRLRMRLEPRDFRPGFHFQGIRRRQFFEKYFRDWKP